MNYQEYVCIMHTEFSFCENSKTSPQLNGADHWLPQTVMPGKSRPSFKMTAMAVKCTLLHYSYLGIISILLSQLNLCFPGCFGSPDFLIKTLLLMSHHSYG
jgi:antibiotic biosynthesis monooxygenase (ABM) superfamily enzyme